MIRVYHDNAWLSLFVGNQEDEKAITNPDEWAIIHAAKEPYHREALGYTGRSAPKDHPEYLMAYRPCLNTLPKNRLILNLVDVEDPKYVHPSIMRAAMWFIDQNAHVLVHCNQGASRSPTIAMLYLHSIGKLPLIFEAAEAAFKEIYPPYCPGKGMRGFAQAHWEEYRNRGWEKVPVPTTALKVALSRDPMRPGHDGESKK